MGRRIRVLLVSAAVVAALGPLAAVHAQSVSQPDNATTQAIANWRAATLMLVSPQFHDIVAATYNGQHPDVDQNWFDQTMIAKAQAEQIAFQQLDPAAVALIQTFYASTQVENVDQGGA